MKKLILFVCGVLLAVQNSYSVEAGVYHCVPLHAVHLMKEKDGSFSELRIDTEGVIAVIIIDADKIAISDSRSGKSRLIEIIANEPGGSIQGRSGLRRFYMDGILHYFYGSIDEDGTVAYAEDGMCSRFMK